MEPLDRLKDMISRVGFRDLVLSEGKKAHQGVRFSTDDDGPGIVVSAAGTRSVGGEIPEGICVVDVDYALFWPEQWGLLSARKLETLTVQSPHGIHLYYQLPEPAKRMFPYRVVDLMNSRLVMGTGGVVQSGGGPTKRSVDFLGVGWIVIPPSPGYILVNPSPIARLPLPIARSVLGAFWDDRGASMWWR
jgi:hypothetical protein